jgi:hypothetical protein
LAAQLQCSKIGFLGLGSKIHAHHVGKFFLSISWRQHLDLEHSLVLYLAACLWRSDNPIARLLLPSHPKISLDYRRKSVEQKSG